MSDSPSAPCLAPTISISNTKKTMSPFFTRQSVAIHFLYLAKDESPLPLFFWTWKDKPGLPQPIDQ